MSVPTVETIDYEQFTGYAIENESRELVLAVCSEFPEDLRLFSAAEEVRLAEPPSWHRTEDQGPMGSCQGHAITSCMEKLYYCQTGEIEQFSRLAAYIWTQEKDGLAGSDRGSTISGGVFVATNRGLPRESVAPYPNPVRYTTQIPQAAVADAVNYRVRRSAHIRTYEDARRWIGSNVGAISIGTRWPIRMEGDRVEHYLPQANGGHAWVVMYVATITDHLGRPYFWCVNSHGSRFARNGWFLLSPIAFEAMLNDRWTTAIGVTDMTTPAPREVDWSGSWSA